MSDPERPAPRIGERIVLRLPHLPEAMRGLRILHVSDLHVRRFRPHERRLIDALSRERADLVFLTGDYVSTWRDERVGVRTLKALVEALDPVYGFYGSFGNHDSPAFKRAVKRSIDEVIWLDHEARALPELGAILLGASTPCDALAAAMAGQDEERRVGMAPNSLYRILLAHEPNILVSAADLGIEWTVAGHTHGGQIRLPLTPLAPHNYSDLPGRLSSGILRLRDSICTLSRGLGESVVNVRLFCPTHVPLYTLEPGPLPGAPARTMTCVQWW